MPPSQGSDPSSEGGLRPQRVYNPLVLARYFQPAVGTADAVSLTARPSRRDLPQQCQVGLTRRSIQPPRPGIWPVGALDRLVEVVAKSPTRRVHPTARLDGCRAAGTTAVKLLPPYRSAGDARARLPGQSLAWPRLPAHPCVHVARKHGPARWRCPPLRHCAHVDTTVGDHSSVCVL